MSDTLPWYRQFWPWFIILLPASVVVAGLTTVVIAFKNADSLVNDDYFKEGLAINQSIEQDELARALNLTATLVWDKLTGEIIVLMQGDTSNPAAKMETGLKLLLLHPTDAAKDLELALSHVGDNKYFLQLEQVLRYHYYVRLMPDSQEKTWRLNGTMDFETSRQVSIGYE